MPALVLGGGAAWGLSHIGVIEVLREEGIPIDLVAGTSVGAIIGSLLARELTTEEIIEVVAEVQWTDLGTLTVPRLGFADSSSIETFLEELIGTGCEFSDLEIPLKIVATDLRQGGQVVLDEGLVARAARASACIPVIFTPVESDNTLLVDGGVVNNLPVDVARAAGASRIIAVELAQSFPKETPDNLAELGYMAFAVMQKRNTEANSEDADVLLRPDLDGFSSMDLSAHEELIERGRREAISHLEEIRELV
ncbi:MAG: patatin-like phospholipase family protein [Bacillota bacterium]